MPTLSASDYTQYLKFKAAAATPIRPAIQTRDNVTLSQSVVNANILASQAALVVNPSTSRRDVLTAVVTDASTKTVTTARTDVLSAATANGSVITYTSSQAHGLTDGSTITVSGFTGTLSPTPNRTGVVTVVNATSFTIPAVAAASGTATGTGSITGRVYYTTSVAHGLVASDTVTITGLSTFNVSAKTVLAAPTATTFVVSDTTTGTAETGQTATIAGFIYYTTDVAHGLGAGQLNVTITGITGTTVFNLSLATIFRAPSTTVLMIQSSITGNTVSSQTGVLSVTTYRNPTTVISSNTRVQGQPPNYVNRPDAKSTLSFAGTSGALGSSRAQQPGGLPTGFKNSQGSYYRVPQNAGWAQGGAGNLSSGPKRF